jgi:hypothetical protein
VSGAGTLADVTVTGTATASLANPGFESALGAENLTTYPANPTGNWFGYIEQSSTAQRVPGALIDGTYAGRIQATGYYDGGEDLTFPGKAQLVQRVTKSLIDSGSLFTFKVANVTGGATTGGSVFLSVVAYTAAGTNITATANDADKARLWGDPLGSASNSSIVVGGPSTSPVSRTINLKTWISANLTAGHTWAEVDHIDVQFSAVRGLTSGVMGAVFDSISTAAPDATAPTMTGFAVGTPSYTSVPVTLLTATDNVGVTGYAITTSNVTPESWQFSPSIASYSVPSGGTYTLYAWARDAVGNISAPLTTSATFVDSPSDNFNRADGALGSNWTRRAGEAGSNVVYGNAARAGAATGWSGDLWTANTFNDNQFAEALVTPSGANGGPGVVVRGSTSLNSCYFAQAWEHATNGPTLALYKIVSGTLTQLGGLMVGGTIPPAAPFILRLEVSGTTLTVKTGTTHGTYNVQATVTDSAIASGIPGIRTYNDAGTPIGRVDNWYGGDL